MSRKIRVENSVAEELSLENVAEENTEDTIEAQGLVDGHKVTKRFSVASSSWPRTSEGKKTQLSGIVVIDFEGVKYDQLLQWAASNRVIDLQRPLRLCELGFAKQLLSHGITRHATEIGVAFEDPAIAFNKAVNAFKGMTPEQRAALLTQLANL